MTLLLAGLAMCVLLWSAAIVVDFRASRCPLEMYFRDTRHLIAPLNATLYLGTPKAGRTAFLTIDSAMFPHFESFRQHWRSILEEAARVSVPEMARSDRGFAFEGIGSPGWRQFFIRWHGTIDSAAVELCPATSRLVEAAPEIKIAFFSVLEPNTHIKAHVGPYRGVLRYQMGLRTPNDPRCYISVGEMRHTYSDGGDVLFDDTYVHAVQNSCDQPRVILFLDIERPFKGRLARAFNRLVLRAVSLFPGKSNTPAVRLPPNGQAPPRLS
jgi:beta-hydroxylase